jgi:hypothetical protein
MEIVIWGLVELLAYVFSAMTWDFGGGSPAAKEPRDAPRPPVKALVVRTRDACVYCRNRNGAFVACRACRAPHHAECARFNGRCAVYGCGGREFRARAA